MTPTANNPRLGYSINRDFGSLPPEERATYIALIREGTPAAVAQATALFGRARRDAADVKDALAILARRPEVRTAEPALRQIDRRLEEIARELTGLVVERDRLLAERSDVTDVTSALPGWKHRIGMAMTSAAVVAALRPELVAAGLLEA